MKALYYGDNLQVLRDSIATESVYLLYLDPPFNSNAPHHVGNRGVSRPQFRAAACPFIAKNGLCHLLSYELEGITHSYFARIVLARASIFAASAPRPVSRSRTA